jgi:hypothetical protein
MGTRRKANPFGLAFLLSPSAYRPTLPLEIWPTTSRMDSLQDVRQEPSRATVALGALASSKPLMVAASWCCLNQHGIRQANALATLVSLNITKTVNTDLGQRPAMASQ